MHSCSNEFVLRISKPKMSSMPTWRNFAVAASPRPRAVIEAFTRPTSHENRREYTAFASASVASRACRTESGTSAVEPWPDVNMRFVSANSTLRTLSPRRCATSAAAAAPAPGATAATSSSPPAPAPTNATLPSSSTADSTRSTSPCSGSAMPMVAMAARVPSNSNASSMPATRVHPDRARYA